MVKETAVGLDEITIDQDVVRKKRRVQRVVQIVTTIILTIATVVSIGAAYINIIYTPIYIDGLSMYPTLNDLTEPTYKEFGFMDARSKALNSIGRGDIVVFRRIQESGSSYLIKRIIGLPLEQIKIENNPAGDTVYIRIDSNNDVFSLPEEYLSDGARIASASGTYGVGSYYSLGENEYFMMGDNRANSQDSRFFGAINFTEIMGVLKAVQGYAKNIETQPDGKAILKNRVWYPMWAWRYY